MIPRVLSLIRYIHVMNYNIIVHGSYQTDHHSFRVLLFPLFLMEKCFGN